MHQRTLFIADHLRGTRSVSELCTEYGISRKTAYKWINRFIRRGPAGLEDRSRRPRSALNGSDGRRKGFGSGIAHRQGYRGVFETGSRLSDEVGFRLDVVEALRELRVPIVRSPGGRFVSAHHWMDGVGKTNSFIRPAASA
jgi:hypothetical protein